MLFGTSIMPYGAELQFEPRCTREWLRFPCGAHGLKKAPTHWLYSFICWKKCRARAARPARARGFPYTIRAYIVVIYHCWLSLRPTIFSLKAPWQRHTTLLACGQGSSKFGVTTLTHYTSPRFPISLLPNLFSSSFILANAVLRLISPQHLTSETRHAPRDLLSLPILFGPLWASCSHTIPSSVSRPLYYIISLYFPVPLTVLICPLTIVLHRLR